MVAVVVRDDDVVQLILLKLRRADHGHDALEIAVVVAARAGIEQQRLAGRRDEQHGFSAFGVHIVDIQRRLRWALNGNHPAVHNLRGLCLCVEAGRRN